VIIVLASISFGVITKLRKRNRLTIEEVLEDEGLERIRTLLQSHPTISLERLALLANMDMHQTSESIEQLQRKGLLGESIQISENEIIRESKSSEKQSM
jgi:hypothetical protein